MNLDRKMMVDDVVGAAARARELLVSVRFIHIELYIHRQRQSDN